MSLSIYGEGRKEHGILPLQFLGGILAEFHRVSFPSQEDDMKGCERVEKKQLLASEEKVKLAEEETRQYKRRLEECHWQMREAEITWRHQVALAEKKAQDNWLRAQELERENAELRRENAHLKQRFRT
ncbi:cTAGE family member 6-like [Camelus dromedarius]|uniref:cTAGE family member 6-like n=1 Tax=Camelus dromedarius TaxID=9838 RepID=UPI00311A2921